MNLFTHSKKQIVPNVVRKNAWNNQGTFDNPDLLWYAKGVRIMQNRQLSDPTSWWFFGAIHGEYVVSNDTLGTQPPPNFPNWADIPGIPSVPVTPLPSSGDINRYWDQCQHAGWFFPPWHRGYLLAIENILRGIIKDIGCTYEWGLPYWNYLGPGDEYKIPPAFTQATLPDGTPNPLLVTARYGPQGDGNIYIPIPPVSQACQQNTNYLGDAPAYYGGGTTGFDHFDSHTGSLENNPHNLVHNYIGSLSPQASIWGLMTDPGLAALDPVFYLHHSNIDRMWASWNNAGNLNPTDPNWLNGPAASGDRKFYMPRPDGTAWQFKPDMVNNINQLDYTYDNLSLEGLPMTMADKVNQRLLKLGVPKSREIQISKEMATQSELIGTNDHAIQLSGSGARTMVKLDEPSITKVNRSLMEASPSKLPDEVYLKLENVTGNVDANILTVTVNHQYAGHVSLFGLRTASLKESHHGGAGLTFTLDITDIIDKLHLAGTLSADSLDVIIQPSNRVLDAAKISIGRVTVYRQSRQ
jgi:tyrosinase